MGCSSSKLDEEEAVQLCKDRKDLIKKAVEHRTKFASGHTAYIRSLKRLSAALKDYVDGDDHLDPFTTPPPFNKTTPRFITTTTTTTATLKVNYLRSGGNGNPSVFVEEMPPDTARVESFNYYSPSPVHHYDGYFANSESIFRYSPNHGRPSFPPPSPQRSSQWDFFWNPFSSLDYYGNAGNHFDDDINGLRQVREEEGIPELEEETEHEEIDNPGVDEATVDDDDEDEFETDSGGEMEGECEAETPAGATGKRQCVEVSRSENSGRVANREAEEVVSARENKDEGEKPGFTVYVNRRPTSMSEVIKDLEAQFTTICDSAKELSAMLEANRAQYLSTSHDLTAMKMLNPVSLLRSASSSRSNSSRFLMNSSSNSKDEDYASSDLSEESCMFSNSHQSTLDKLYAWEKKLYHEVREGERVRIAYEKKCAQLRNHDVRGDDHSSVDKTRTAIRNLHTQIKVSIHSVEAVSKRIETLRDQELQPQLLELIQGLSRMWKVMAECHQTQKRTLDEAKILLAGTPSKPNKVTFTSPSEPHRLARSALNLETELRNWKSCFESWIMSQRSYIHAITGWLLRCTGADPNNATRFPFSPRKSAGAPPMFGVCIGWARLLDSVSEVPVLDGLDFFAAGVGSLYVQQLKEGGSGRTPLGSSRRYSGGMELAETGRQEAEEEVMTAEKMAEVAIRVLCAGMSVAVSSLTEFALCSAKGYADLISQWESAKCVQSSGGSTK